MMSAVNVAQDLTIGALKRSLPNYVVDSTRNVAATRMRFFRNSFEELRDDEPVWPQNQPAVPITLEAIIDHRLCACGNQSDTDLVSMCDYCHFGACDSCCHDDGERFCGHCDKFCCCHCLQKHDITQGWGHCKRRCSQWICPECIASITPCKH